LFIIAAGAYRVTSRSSTLPPALASPITGRVCCLPPGLLPVGVCCRGGSVARGRRRFAVPTYGCSVPLIMSGYGCPIEPCSARYVHRQSLKRHLLAFHHMMSDTNDGLRPVSPATIDRIAPGMRRSAENSRQRRSRWAVERAVAAAVSSDGPPDPRSPVGFIRPRPDSGEIPSSGAVIEDLGRRRLRRNATVGRRGTKVPSSSPSAAWCYSPRRDESVVTPSAAESAAAFRIRGPLPHLRSRSSSPNFFGRPSGSRPASDVDSSDELGT